MALDRDNDLASDRRFDWALAELKYLVARGEDIGTVFDIGSGDERLARDVRNMGLEYLSFDVAPATATVRHWNIEEPFPYEGSADVVIFLEIVEHLNNPWLGVRNIARVLRPGGYLILSTPNPAWSASRLSLLGRGALTMFTEQDLILNHHVFTPWRHVVERLLLDNGITDLRFAALGKATNILAKPFWGFKMPLRLVFRLMKTVIERVDRQARGAAYGVVGRNGSPS